VLPPSHAATHVCTIVLGASTSRNSPVSFASATRTEWCGYPKLHEMLALADTLRIGARTLQSERGAYRGGW